MSFQVPKITNPEELIINREEFDSMEDKMAELLSDLERKVLSLYLGRPILSGNF